MRKCALLLRRHAEGQDTGFDSDSPHKPPIENVVYRDDTAGRPLPPQVVEVV